MTVVTESESLHSGPLSAAHRVVVRPSVARSVGSTSSRMRYFACVQVDVRAQ